MTAWYLKKPRRAKASSTPGRPKPYKAPTLLERPVQRNIVEFLEALGLRVAAVPNGAALGGDLKSRVKRINAMKKDGLRTGFPDLIVYGRKPGQVGVMEVKREVGGGLDEDQEGWRDFFLEVGHPWAMVRGIDDAQAALKTWGWIA